MMRAQLGFSAPGAGSRVPIFFIRRTKTSCIGTNRYLLETGMNWDRNCEPAMPRISRPFGMQEEAAMATAAPNPDWRSQMKAFGDAQHVNRSAVDNPGFHQSWFPVALACELESNAVLGVDFL